MNLTDKLFELLTAGMTSEQVIALMDSLVEDGAVHQYRHRIERNEIVGQCTELNGFSFRYGGAV